MARTAIFRRRLAALLIGGLMAVGGFAGTPESRAEESPLFCGYVRSHIGVTQPIWLGWYCDTPAHPSCDGFPYVGPGNVFVADFFVCSNV